MTTKSDAIISILAHFLEITALFPVILNTEMWKQEEFFSAFFLLNNGLGLILPLPTGKYLDYFLTQKARKVQDH